MLLQPIENVDKQMVQHVQNLIVMLIDGHLEVQPRELAQVPVCERLLCPAESTKPQSIADAGQMHHPMWFCSSSLSQCSPVNDLQCIPTKAESAIKHKVLRL